MQDLRERQLRPSGHVFVNITYFLRIITWPTITGCYVSTREEIDVFHYRQCIERYHNDYFLERAVINGELRKVEKGVYSDTPSWSELALVAFKNRDAVFTLNSAFYYQDLTDSIPDRYYLGTGRVFSEKGKEKFQQHHNVLNCVFCNICRATLCFS